MLTTPHKRFVWARSQRFTDFSDWSFFRTMLAHRRRPAARVAKEQQQRAGGRWKPAAWTPWLWIK
jgi:hypothetical protein